ncbi:MAG TPA: glycosyltransferase [Acidimicrobiales bacterium]|nr:glycosyltransferase [Acidimicrobiales bacterium]
MSTEGVTVSVAMCTCDGVRFLGRQLESILGQTLPPDELVVFDDCSTDGTFELLRGFADSAPFPVILRRNEARVGVPSNFSAAMAATSGDFILLSDQDDEWRDDRIARSVAVLGATGAAGVFSDARIIDADSRPTGERLWDRMRFTGAQRRRGHRGDMLATLLSHQVVTGATLAVRASWLPLLLPVDPHGLHDAWISVLLAAAATVVAIDEPLVSYREHGGNQVGVRPQSPLARLAQRGTAVARYGDEVEQFRAIAERLRSWPGIRPEAVALVEAKVDHVARRDGIGTGGNRIAAVVGEVVSGRYFRYSRGWESAMYDLLLRK